MKTDKRIKYIHEGKYVAEVEVSLIEAGEGWAPYLSLEDAYKLDDVRDALRNGEVSKASRLGKIYTLSPVNQ